MLRTDGVRHGESAGAGAVVLKVPVAWVTGTAYSGNPMEPLLVRLSFSTPTSGTEVDMRDSYIIVSEAMVGAEKVAPTRSALDLQRSGRVN